MREKIIEFMKNHPHSVYGKGELARRLGIAKSDHKHFRIQFRNLLDEGKILRAPGKGYVWAGTGEKVVGVLTLNQKGFGFVIVDGGDDIFVSSKRLRGAVHGDTVEVTLLPYYFGKGTEGQVSRIIRRGTEEFLGTVIARNGMRYLEIDTVTPRRGIRIVESLEGMSKGDAIVAKVVDWGRGREPIQVRAVKIIGSMDNPEDDMKIICHKFDLNPEFPAEVLMESEKFDEAHIQKEIPNRTDLRHVPCLTIDPADAKDFDDAISLEKDEQGNALIGVHIADVSSFVPTGSETDREARKRGTSVYLSEGAVHMLPEKLSALLCSLVPRHDRLAVSLLMTLNDSCDVIDASIHPSTVRNVRRFTYGEVQSILDGKTDSRFSRLLKEMFGISQKLMKKRQAEGSIDFDIPEPIFRFGNGGIPHEIHPSERLDSHRIVEEFMLLANRTVAERLWNRKEDRLPFIYRVHDQPPREDIERFLEQLKQLRLYDGPTTGVGPSGFRQLLSTIQDSPYRSLMENLALRTMTKAIYSVKNRGHYGLAFDKYTHFTSPIRRYPDLTVHRILKESLLKPDRSGSDVYKDNLALIAKESTEAEINAMEAERDYIKLKQLRWLAQHADEQFHGIISGVVPSGFFVELKDTMVEGFIRLDSLEDDDYTYDEAEFCLVGRTRRERYQLGRTVTVTVRDVLIEKRRADFLLVG